MSLTLARDVIPDPIDFLNVLVCEKPLGRIIQRCAVTREMIRVRFDYCNFSTPAVFDRRSNPFSPASRISRRSESASGSGVGSQAAGNCSVVRVTISARKLATENNLACFVGSLAVWLDRTGSGWAEPSRAGQPARKQVRRHRNKRRTRVRRPLYHGRTGSLACSLAPAGERASGLAGRYLKDR